MSEECEALVQKLHRPQAEWASILIERAAIFQHTGHLDDAMQCYASVRSRGEVSKPLERDIASRLAVIYFLKGDFTNALKEAEALLACSSDHPIRAGQAYLKMTDIQRCLHKYEEATVNCQKSLQLFTEQAEFELASQANSLLGRLFFYLGDYDKAVVYHSLDLKLCNEHKLDSVRPLFNLSVAHITHGHFDKGIEVLNNVISATSNVSHIHSRAELYLASIHMQRHQVKQATIHYKRVIDALSAVKGKTPADVLELLFNAYRGIGHAFFDMSDFDLEMSAHEAHLKLASASRRREEELYSSIALALCHAHQGRAELSTQFENRAVTQTLALGITESINRFRPDCNPLPDIVNDEVLANLKANAAQGGDSQCRHLINLSRAFMARNEVAPAITTLLQALDVAGFAGSKQIIAIPFINMHLAFVYLRQT